VTPQEGLIAFPEINSVDASSWIHSVKFFTGLRERTCLKSLGNAKDEFRCRINDTPNRQRALAMGGVSAAMLQRNWRNIFAHYRETTS